MIKQFSIYREKIRVKIISEEIELNKDFQEVSYYMKNERQNIGMENY